MRVRSRVTALVEWLRYAREASGFPCSYQRRTQITAAYGACQSRRDGVVHRLVRQAEAEVLTPAAEQRRRSYTGFQTCCIADFQVGKVGKARDAIRSARLETRDTADLEVCATVAVPGCASAPLCQPPGIDFWMPPAQIVGRMNS